jgi:hypothetical protein
MTSPDSIADQAILTISAWQRETSQQMADRLLPLWQARKHLPPELRLNDNNQDQYGATLGAVRGEKAHV